MAFIFTLKETGETIVLPTPSGDKQTEIDTLPGGALTDLEIELYLKRMKKVWLYMARPTPPHKK